MPITNAWPLTCGRMPYAKDMIQDYVNIANTKVFKRVHTIFLAKVAKHLDDDGGVGELATSASSVLMTLM